MKVAKNMDSVFDNCSDQSLDFDIFFDDDDTIIDIVSGVDKFGVPLTGPNPEDTYQLDGDGSNDDPAEGSKEIELDDSGEQGKEGIRDKNSAESQAYDVTPEIKKAIGEAYLSEDDVIDANGNVVADVGDAIKMVKDSNAGSAIKKSAGSVIGKAAQHIANASSKTKIGAAAAGGAALAAGAGLAAKKMIDKKRAAAAAKAAEVNKESFDYDLSDYLDEAADEGALEDNDEVERLGLDLDDDLDSAVEIENDKCNEASEYDDIFGLVYEDTLDDYDSEDLRNGTEKYSGSDMEGISQSIPSEDIDGGSVADAIADICDNGQRSGKIVAKNKGENMEGVNQRIPETGYSESAIDSIANSIVDSIAESVNNKLGTMYGINDSNVMPETLSTNEAAILFESAQMGIYSINEAKFSILPKFKKDENLEKYEKDAAEVEDFLNSNNDDEDPEVRATKSMIAFNKAGKLVANILSVAIAATTAAIAAKTLIKKEDRDKIKNTIGFYKANKAYGAKFGKDGNGLPLFKGAAITTALSAAIMAYSYIMSRLANYAYEKNIETFVIRNANALVAKLNTLINACADEGNKNRLIAMRDKIEKSRDEYKEKVAMKKKEVNPTNESYWFDSFDEANDIVPDGHFNTATAAAAKRLAKKKLAKKLGVAAGALAAGTGAAYAAKKYFDKKKKAAESNGEGEEEAKTESVKFIDANDLKEFAENTSFVEIAYKKDGVLKKAIVTTESIVAGASAAAYGTNQYIDMASERAIQNEAFDFLDSFDEANDIVPDGHFNTATAAAAKRLAKKKLAKKLGVGAGALAAGAAAAYGAKKLYDKKKAAEAKGDDEANGDDETAKNESFSLFETNDFFQA